MAWFERLPPLEGRFVCMLEVVPQQSSSHVAALEPIVQYAVCTSARGLEKADIVARGAGAWRCRGDAFAHRNRAATASFGLVAVARSSYRFCASAALQFVAKIIGDSMQDSHRLMSFP